MDNNQNDQFIDVTQDNTVDQNTVYEQPEVQNNLPPDENPAKKKKGLIIGIIVGVLVLVLGVFAFFYFNNNSKLILSKNITKLYNDFLSSSQKNESLKNILSSNEVSANSDITLNLKDNTGTFGNINNFKASYQYIENKEDKKGSLNFESKLDNEDFINLDAAIKDSKLYYKIKDVMDKYYYNEYEFISLLSTSESDDIKYVLDIIKDNIINNINKSNLKESKEEIKINDKNTKVKKISLEITEELVNKIIKGTIDSIEKDDKAIDILSESFDIEKDELNKLLNTIKDSLNEETSDIEFDKVTYNMYVKGLNTTVKQEIVIGEVSLEYYDYKNVKEFSVSSNSLKVFNIKFENGQISGSMLTIAISGDYSDDKINLDIKSIDNSFELKITIENTEKDINKNKEYESNTNINATMLQETKEVFNLNLSLKSSLKNDVSVKDFDTSNSKNQSELTEEEQNEFIEKIQNIPVIKSIIENASNMSGINSYDEDDYYFDYDEDFNF